MCCRGLAPGRVQSRAAPLKVRRDEAPAVAAVLGKWRCLPRGPVTGLGGGR